MSGLLLGLPVGRCFTDWVEGWIWGGGGGGGYRPETLLKIVGIETQTGEAGLRYHAVSLLI